MNDQVCFKPRPFETAFLQSGTGYGAFTTDSVLIYDEIEAVVVISWLYELEIYDPHKASSFTLNRIIRIIKSYLDREGENGAEESSVIAFKAVLTDFGRILQERELIKSSI